MIQFLTNALSVQRTSNIIFVCGGNNSEDMRACFRKYCEQHLTGFEIFLPEFAMDTIYGDELEEPFDLAEFEELVGAVSCAVVVFPEGPGSYAETGYFSAVPKLAQKCILVLDINQQGGDSFISMGPAKKISEASAFHPNISLNYLDPKFNDILDRIKTRRKYKTRKSLTIGEFSDLSPYEIAAILHMTVKLCTIATIKDVQYLFRALFSNRLSMAKVRKLWSVLIGSKHLLEVGSYGHFATNPSRQTLAIVRDGYKSRETELRLELAASYQDHDPEFLRLVEAAPRAD